MTKAHMNLEDGLAELPDLYREHERRTAHAFNVLREKGMSISRVSGS